MHVRYLIIASLICTAKRSGSAFGRTEIECASAVAHITRIIVKYVGDAELPNATPTLTLNCSLELEICTLSTLLILIYPNLKLHLHHQNELICNKSIQVSKFRWKSNKRCKRTSPGVHSCDWQEHE